MAMRGLTKVTVKAGIWAGPHWKEAASHRVDGVRTCNEYLVITRHLVYPKRFVITHTLTGFAACNNLLDVPTAKLVAAAIGELFDWNTADYGSIKARFATLPMNLRVWIKGWSIAD